MTLLDHLEMRLIGEGVDETLTEEIIQFVHVIINTSLEEIEELNDIEFGSLNKQIDELTQALIKEQDEVLKYKPVYLELIAENITLKERFNELLKEATSSNRLSSFTVISILEGL